MKEFSIAKQIVTLRKKAGITQEQLAQELHVSPQAVSKWETSTCQPDTVMLPMIAEYFHVSIDYLFYGKNLMCEDLYAQNGKKVKAYPQMSRESYEEAHRLFAYAHHGISHGNLLGRGVLYDQPAHISNEHGVSLLSGRGYGAIVTRKFFEGISRETAEFALPWMEALSDRNRMLACMAILSMSDISFGELRETLALSEEELRTALDGLISSGLIKEKKSKHRALGFTYEIVENAHTCLCVLLATIEMQRFSEQGISCCMGFGDYPISL